MVAVGRPKRVQKENVPDHVTTLEHIINVGTVLLMIPQLKCSISTPPKNASLSIHFHFLSHSCVGNDDFQHKLCDMGALSSLIIRRSQHAPVDESKLYCTQRQDQLILNTSESQHRLERSPVEHSPEVDPETSRRDGTAV